MATKGVRYAYAYDKSGKLSRHFGVRGIPHAVLVDATGTVLWSGHPAALEESVLEQALKGALPKPIFEWSAAAKGVKSALLKHSYKSAIDQASKLGAEDGGPEILAAIQGIVASEVEGMRAAFGAGDFLTAQQTAQRLQDQLAGLPDATEAAELGKRIAADKDAQAVIKGQLKVDKIRSSSPSKKKDVEAAIESLRKLRKDYPGSHVEVEADALIAQYSEMLRGGD